MNRNSDHNGHKVCGVCNVMLTDANRYPSVKNTCKQCIMKRSKEYRKTHREKYNMYMRTKYNTDPEYKKRHKICMKNANASMSKLINSMTDEEYLEFCRKVWGAPI